jgi:hypothetical protein
MMIMVRGTGVPHSGQAFAGKTLRRVEKWPRVLFTEMPACFLFSIHQELKLMAWQGNDFAPFFHQHHLASFEVERIPR